VLLAGPPARSAFEHALLAGGPAIAHTMSRARRSFGACAGTTKVLRRPAGLLASAPRGRCRPPLRLPPVLRGAPLRLRGGKAFGRFAPPALPLRLPPPSCPLPSRGRGLRRRGACGSPRQLLSPASLRRGAGGAVRRCLRRCAPSPFRSTAPVRRGGLAAARARGAGRPGPCGPFSLARRPPGPGVRERRRTGVQAGRNKGGAVAPPVVDKVTLFYASPRLQPSPVTAPTRYIIGGGCCSCGPFFPHLTLLPPTGN